MNRREFLASGAAISLAALPKASAQVQIQAHGQAIAEGGPLTPPKDRPIQVAIAVSAGVTWIDFVGPLAVFETFHFDPIEKKHKPRFSMTLVSEKPGPAKNLVPDHTFETAPKSDIILIPAQPASEALTNWIRKAAESAEVTMSVCTGAAHLARAGLLNGKQATTHHDSIERFSRDFPEVKWVRGMRFVEGKKISTGGGLTAGIDLALRVTERYFGRAWAEEVAQHLEYEGRGWII